MCYEAIIARDIKALGKSMNECMLCWEEILPGTVRHRLVKTDLISLLKYYQSKYPGAMYSGCGGGYLYVASDTPVPAASLSMRKSPYIFRRSQIQIEYMYICFVIF
jgi:hypothetical protein